MAATGKLPGQGPNPSWGPAGKASAVGGAGGDDRVQHVVENVDEVMAQTIKMGVGDWEYSLDALARSAKNYQLWNHRR